MHRAVPTVIVLSLMYAFTPSLRAEDASTTRKWSDQTGRYSVQATIVAVERQEGRPRVILRKLDGTVIAVPYAKLSHEDQKYAVEWYKQKKNAAPKNPPDRSLPGVGDQVKVHWGSKWWKASIVEVDGERLKIHYDGWGDNWDEWKTPDQLRWRDDSPVVPGGPADPAMAAKEKTTEAAAKPTARTANDATPTPGAASKATAALAPSSQHRGGRSIPPLPPMANAPRIPPVPRPFGGPRNAPAAASSAPAVEIDIADGNEPVAPAPPSTFPAELSPQQTLEHLKTQLLAGKLQTFWDWLPDEFRAYANGGELRDQLEALSKDNDVPGVVEILRELVVVMRKQKEFVLNSPRLFSSWKSEENRQLLHDVYDPATELLDELTQLGAHFESELRSDNFDAVFRQRLDRIGPHVAEVFQAIPPDMLQTVWDHVEIQTGPSGARLVTDRVDGTQGVFRLMQVDGRWLPTGLVEYLSAMPEALEKKVASRKTASQNPSDAEAFDEQMAEGFQAGLSMSLVEGLQELAATGSQEEFDTALYALTIKVQLFAISALRS